MGAGQEAGEERRVRGGLRDKAVPRRQQRRLMVVLSERKPCLETRQAEEGGRGLVRRVLWIRSGG